MKQLIHVHGGEAFDTHEAYLAFLREHTIDDPMQPSEPSWRDTYAETLGDEWYVIKVRMPSSLNAKYEEWALWFEKYLPYIHDGAVLVGHSLGANFLAKYLAEHTLPFSVGQLHLVAGCFGYVAGFALPDSLERVTQQCPSIVLYHSHDDTIVPIADLEKYRAALPSAEVVVLDNRGHFLSGAFPELIARITQ